MTTQQHQDARTGKERLRVYLPAHLAAFCHKQPQGSTRFIEQLILDHIRIRTLNPVGRNAPQRNDNDTV